MLFRRKKKIDAIVIAAGKGKRMGSDLPKTLHLVGGKPMIRHVVDCLREVGVNDPVIVVSNQSEPIRSALGKMRYAVQTEQLGTADATRSAQKFMDGKAIDAIVMYGDTPLFTPTTIKELVTQHDAAEAVISVVTADLPDPTNYGRIVRSEKNFVERIVEEKDASPEQKQITEVNGGCYCFDNDWLWKNIELIKNKNAAGEYYLTDMIDLAVRQGKKVIAVKIDRPNEITGVNTPTELMKAETIYKQRV